MSLPAEGNQLVNVVVLLGAAVIAVPLFKRLGLGSVLGYLAAGLAIGPFGIGWFSDPRSILHVAELGVVMFLFIIGLEMQPSRLWKLRGEIFGLGVAQVAACGALLTAVGLAAGLSGPAAFMAAMGFVLSSTAIVMQILAERDETASAQGQRIVSILLLEDLAIVPLLALVALLAPAGASEHGDPWLQSAIALGCVLALLAAGRWLLNPLFRLLAAAHAREVMTAAALLVVLGAALLMEFGGLSMAMGAFLAGVLLSESTFRHQLEAEVEPFRGILLGLFFLGVGMSLDLAAVAREWQLILAGVVVFMAVKSVGVYLIARLLRASHAEALTRAALLAQGGEFAFVLYGAAAAAGIFDAHLAAVLIAVVIISMALTPLCVLALRWLLPKPAAVDGGSGCRPGPGRLRADRRFRPLRPDRDAGDAGARHQGIDPGYRHRCYPRRRQVGRQGLLRGRNSHRHAAHRRRRNRQGHPDLHRQSAIGQSHGQADQGRIPAGATGGAGL
jgi:glutathione-regulated potassium-efflux system protein KefB